jgi:hypothetical protein
MKSWPIFSSDVMLLKISATLWETPPGVGVANDISAKPEKKNNKLQKIVRFRINKVYPRDILFQNFFPAVASAARAGRPFLVKPVGLCYHFSVPSKRIAMIIV